MTNLFVHLIDHGIDVILEIFIIIMIILSSRLVSSFPIPCSFSVEFCVCSGNAIDRASPVVHDQDLHTSAHKSFQLAVQVVMNDTSFVIQFGYLELSKPVQLLDQVLELLV